MSRRTALSPANEVAPELDGDLRGLIGYCISRAFHRVRVKVGKALEPFGLRRVTFSALSIIHGTPGLNQAALADALYVERPNVVAIVDELEKAGFVRRERSATDRRAYALRLTEAGDRVLTAAMAEVRSIEVQLSAGLTGDDRRRLIRSLQRIEETE